MVKLRIDVEKFKNSLNYYKIELDISDNGDINYVEISEWEPDRDICVPGAYQLNKHYGKYIPSKINIDNVSYSIRLNQLQSNTNIKTVYIAGKITGKKEYWKDFYKAQADIESLGKTVINPACLPASEHISYETYMKITLTMLEACDAVYFLPDWTESPGAIREYQKAKELGKILII